MSAPATRRAISRRPDAPRRNRARAVAQAQPAAAGRTTVGLDIKARADILAHVRSLVAQENLAVLWTTHLIDEVEPGDKVVVLHLGKMLANGTAAEIVSAQGVETIGAAFEKLTAEAKP